MNTTELFITIAICSLTTIATRFAAFAIFPKGRKVPAFVSWLGKELPGAVMAMLLVYCLKDLSFGAAAGWTPAVAGMAATVALHLWKKQMILSIAGGTAVYMVLLRVI